MAKPRTPIDYFDSKTLREGLKKKTVRGGLISAVGQVISIAISLAVIPILSRLLDSADFGLIAMVAVLTNFGRMFVDAGLSMATVQRDQITHQQVSNLFWIATSLGTLIALAVACLSPGVAWLYNEPRLTAITLALATSFVLSGLAVQHQALLRRGMQFTALTVINVVSVIIGQVAGIAWAWNYYGTEDDYWALVIIPLVTASVRTIGILLACRWRPSFPAQGVGTRSLVTFGANLTGFSFVNFFSRNADNLLIGWWWGETLLGFYDQAYKLFLFPLQSINSPLSAVMIPGLSRVANDKDRMNAAYIRILRLLLLILVPAIVAVAITSEWWVIFLLGPKWEASAPILRCLAIAGIVQPFSNSAGWLFIAQGKADAMFRYSLVSAPVTLAFFALGLPWGPLGVAAGYAISGLGFRLPCLVYWMNCNKVLPASVPLRELRLIVPLLSLVALANLGLLLLNPFDSAGTGVAACILTTTACWIIIVTFTQHGRSTATELFSLLGKQRIS